jgi:hypothetical protein
MVLTASIFFNVLRLAFVGTKTGLVEKTQRKNTVLETLALDLAASHTQFAHRSYSGLKTPLAYTFGELKQQTTVFFHEWDRFEAQSKHITFACSLEPTNHFLNFLEIIVSLLSSFNGNTPREHFSANHSVGIHT